VGKARIQVFDMSRGFAEGILALRPLITVGYFSHSVIGAMGDTLRHRLEAQGTKGAITRRVFSTFVEMAQNS